MSGPADTSTLVLSVTVIVNADDGPNIPDHSLTLLQQKDLSLVNPADMSEPFFTCTRNEVTSSSSPDSKLQRKRLHNVSPGHGHQ